MALQKYRSIAEGRRLPAFMRSAQLAIGCSDISGLSTDQLWLLHDTAISCKSVNSGNTEISLLGLKCEIARRLMGQCSLCERKCGVDRTAGQIGFCGVGAKSFYFFEQTLWGEEPPLVPSHEVFLSGCNLRCKYCYSWKSLLDPRVGKPVMPEEFAALAARRRKEGASNLNLIGGEPTVHLATILDALRSMNSPTPIIWNSNFHMSEPTMRLLDGVVDLYLGDFRFGNNRCAEKLAGVCNYVPTAQRNFKLAAQSGNLIIRHLVVPGHIDCCLRPIAKWVAENLPDVPFNPMMQYAPFYKALEDQELCRSLTPEEEADALDIVSSYKLNTSQWKQPLNRNSSLGGIGSGEISTTIMIRPDGQVGIMHLHGELLNIVRTLGCGG